MSGDDELNSNGDGPGQSAGDANEQITEQVEDKTGEDIDSLLEDEKENKEDFKNAFNESSQDVASSKENAADAQANAVGGLLSDAIGYMANLTSRQEEFKEDADKMKNLAGAKMSLFKTMFGGEGEGENREEKVTIDGDVVESKYNSFKSEFHSTLDETLPMAWEREELLRKDSNDSMIEAVKGAVDDPTKEKSKEETAELMNFAGNEAEDYGKESKEAVKDVVDEINLEAQALELNKRKKTYEDIDSIVGEAIINVKEANGEPSIELMEEALEDAAEQLDVNLKTDLTEDDAERLQNAQEDYFEVAKDVADEDDELVTSLTTNVKELYDEEETDPIEAAKLLRTTVADAYERQADRFETAVDAIEKIEVDLKETKQDYETFTEKAENLQVVEEVGPEVEESMKESSATYETVFDIASSSKTKLERMVDSDHASGDRAEIMRESAQSYIETELAQELGLGNVKEPMEETLHPGEETTINNAIRLQAEAAYHGVDTVKRHTNNILEDDDVLPNSTEATLGDDEEYSADEIVGMASDERDEAYEALGLSPTDLDEIGHVEDSQEINYEE